MEVEDAAELCYPQLLNTSCRKPMSPWPGALLTQILWSSISLLTVALNLLVIISVSHFRQLHTPTNILLLSLAVSDFLVGLLLMPVMTLKKTSCWFFGDLLCSLFCYGSLIITSASVGDMVLISIDRYVAICHPLHYSSRITVNRVKFCVCLCWICSAFYNGFLLKHDLILKETFVSCDGQCVFVFDSISNMVDLIFTFTAPVIIIIVLYAMVFVVAVSQARAMRSHITATTKQRSVTVKSKKSELKAARTLGVLVVVFLICFCPFFCWCFGAYPFLDSPSSLFLTLLFYFNSCLNPVIYALFYPWFRKTMKLICTLQILQPGSSEANVL